MHTDKQTRCAPRGVRSQTQTVYHADADKYDVSLSLESTAGTGSLAERNARPPCRARCGGVHVGSGNAVSPPRPKGTSASTGRGGNQNLRTARHGKCACVFQPQRHHELSRLWRRIREFTIPHHDEEGQPSWFRGGARSHASRLSSSATPPLRIRNRWPAAALSADPAQATMRRKGLHTMLHTCAPTASTISFSAPHATLKHLSAPHCVPAPQLQHSGSNGSSLWMIEQSRALAVLYASQQHQRGGNKQYCHCKSPGSCSWLLTVS